MNNSKYFIDLEEQYGANNYHPLPLVIVKAHGIWVEDVGGNKYMDFLAGYSALNHGHTHTRIQEALVSQAQNVTLTSRAFHNDQLGPFCKEICELSGFEMVLPMNSGAEAVETALKTARKWGYKQKGVHEGNAEIIVCSNNFHGRTISIVSFSTEAQYKDGFGPFTGGFKVVEYNNILAIEAAISPNTVAVMLEPIQGEGGILIPDVGFLRGVSELCKKHNVLFMLDEIQTGFGRTGKLFAYQHEGITPDVLIVGKALGGGFLPISAVLSRKEILGVFNPGDHGSTFGGNPLACAVARTAMKVLIEEKLPEKSDTLGTYLMGKLATIHSKWIKEIRGKGLFIGIELTADSGGARPFCERLMKEGVLCKETHDYVIRLAPPLIIKREEIDTAFKKIKKILESNL